MIFSERSNIRIDVPDQISLLNKEHLMSLRFDDRYKLLFFKVPDSIEGLREKEIYKVGFLTHFLKALYFEKQFLYIYDILISRYEIHVTRRTIERYYKEFRKKYNID